MVTPTPTGFVDLLDLDDETNIVKNEHNENKNNEKPIENMTVIKIEEPLVQKEIEEQKPNNPFSFDFNSLSKNETQKKEIDHIDILFG